MRKTITTAGAASLLALAVSGTTAIAGPTPLEELSFKQATGFVNTDPDNTPPGAVNSFDTSAGNYFAGHGADTDQNPLDGAPEDTTEGFSWGGTDAGDTAGNVSAIGLTGVTSSDGSPVQLMSDLMTPDDNNEWNEGDWWAISTLVQLNDVLALDTGGTGVVPNPLWVADAASNLYIYDPADNVAGNEIEKDSSTTTIEFWETYNSFGDCRLSTDGNPLGTQCDDIFRVSAFDFDEIDFWYEGVKYGINFGLVPGPSAGPNEGQEGTTLVCPNEFDPRCDGVDVTDGEIWVFTPEWNPGTSSLFVVAQWTVIPVPEPSVLGLFGIGVLGLGLAGRRRRQSKS